MHINVIMTVFRFYVFSITESKNLSNHQMVFSWHCCLLLGLRVNPTILLWVLNFLFLVPLAATDLNGSLIQIRFIDSFIHLYIKYILPEHLPTFWLCAGVIMVNQTWPPDDIQSGARDRWRDSLGINSMGQVATEIYRLRSQRIWHLSQHIS